MNFKRILLSGGSGFIGSNLLDRLLIDGYEVFVIDNYRTGRRDNIAHHFNNPKCFFNKMDIQSKDMDTVFRIFKPEIVLHLAAMAGVPFSIENPSDSNETNIQGTINLLELSAKHNVKRFIFSSSSSIYGGSAVLPTSENIPANPKSPYALQKKFGEEYCRMFSKLYDLDTVSLRYFNVFGKRQYGDSPYASVISAFAEAIKNDERPIIYGDGEQTRDFTYIDNVIQANIKACFAAYEQLIQNGVCREQARGLLPTCTYTQFIYTCNLHSFVHFLRLRLHPDAQYEIRVYAQGMLELAQPYFSVSLDAWQKKFLQK